MTSLLDSLKFQKKLGHAELRGTSRNGGDSSCLTLSEEDISNGLSGTTELRADIVKYAVQFVGNPYVWGGTDLDNGADCSGFVQQVLAHFGINVPRASYMQVNQGKTVAFNVLQPGDLIFYMRGARIGHVTMYIGNGKCVQARGHAYGICITDFDYSTPYCAKNVID